MDDKSRHPTRNLKAMLSEAKDTSELMVDLGYAALFFGDDVSVYQLSTLHSVPITNNTPASAAQSKMSFTVILL